VSLSGRTCLVTGATSGIGEATALGLARRGATVVVAGRELAKCEATVARIRRETGNTAVEHLLADLSSQAEVRKLAAGFLRRHGRLDVLVNNAGGVFLRRRLSVDGIEMTLALNHLSHFLLTGLLVDALRNGAPSRVVNVSSGGHRRSRLDLDDLELRRGYAPLKAYYRSKFANVLFTYELARRLKGTGVAANVLHPGLVLTNIARQSGRLIGWGWRLYARRNGALTPEEGALNVLFVASSPALDGVTGAYFFKTTPADSAPGTEDTEAARRLWQVSVKLTGAPWIS
jgi:NAD(P)-dependent dehydrogenase (short-subunit alcohol dehydrogenase family)